MVVRFVVGCMGTLVFFAAPLFSQETTEGPIGTVTQEFYVKNTVRDNAPWSGFIAAEKRTSCIRSATLSQSTPRFRGTHAIH